MSKNVKNGVRRRNLWPDKLKKENMWANEETKVKEQGAIGKINFSIFMRTSNGLDLPKNNLKDFQWFYERQILSSDEKVMAINLK